MKKMLRNHLLLAVMTVLVVMVFMSDGSAQTCSVSIFTPPPGVFVGIKNQPIPLSASASGLGGNIKVDNAFVCGFSQPGSCKTNLPTLTEGVHTLTGLCRTRLGGDSISQKLTIAQTGVIHPKYAILSVIYAPPGSHSSVDYGSSTVLGTSTSLASSFTNSINLSVTVGFKTNSLFGLTPDGMVSGTTSGTDTEEQDSSSSVSINKTTSNDIIVPGPASSAVGVDHDFDLVKIWLNPAAGFMTTGNTSILTNYYFDLADPCNCMDIIELEVGQLKNPASITDPHTLQSLARVWASNLADGSAPGLTNADLLAIAAADPFSNPSYTVTRAAGQPCSADARFCITTNQPIQYLPPGPGGQPFATKYTQTYQVTATQGQAAMDTHQVGFSSDINASAGFLAEFFVDIKTSDTLAWTNKWSSLITQMAGQSATASITGPATADNYTGSTLFTVYQDNVYGTFMFFPAN